MDFNELLKNNQAFVATAALALPALLLFNLMFCCCSFRSNDKSYEDKEVEAVNVDERNSRLAFMLMLLLTENKKSNRKYIRMADSIGYDHIISPTDFDNSEYESDGEDEKDK